MRPEERSPGSRLRFDGERFDDSDLAVESLLQDVSVPALLCSLVHMTGDPAWIRGAVKPRHAVSLDIQSGLTEDEQATIRRLALAAVTAYRDGGCIPCDLDRPLLTEMMSFLGCRPVSGRLAELFIADLAFDGRDSGAIAWGDEVSESARSASPVIVVGCGMGGILAGIRLQQAGLPFIILEKNAGPGGTWWENRYPGARVDVGSQQYCYSFRPEDWSEYYSRQPELRDYFARVVEEYDLGAHIRYETAVRRLEWNEAASAWRVDVEDGNGSETLEARFVISAVGSLNLPMLPDIPGTNDFTGPMFHSARWPEDLDLGGLRFGLVGAGASGFQIGPAVAGEAEQLTVFQRTAQWIIPNPIYRQPVPPGDRWAVRHLPFYGRWLRFIESFSGIASGVDPYRVDPAHDDPTARSVNATNSERAEALVGWMTSVLDGRPDLVEQAIPDYPALGKRILQDDGTWLRTLMRPDVELVRSGIDRIVADGIVTSDGVHRPLDAICFATGFRHNDFLASMEVRGRDGVLLADKWGDEPTAYLGISIPSFPNLFCTYGPGTNLAAGASLFFHAEYQMHHALELIRSTLASGARTCEVTDAAHDDYVERSQAELDTLVWTHPSIRHSHFKNTDGRVFTLSPWPIDLYREWTRRIDRDAYRFH